MPYLGRGPGFGIRQKYFYTASADDTSAVSIDVASSGISHQFIPRGIPADGCTWPHSKSTKYDGS